jgi:hypothetical protein
MPNEITKKPKQFFVRRRRGYKIVLEPWTPPKRYKQTVLTYELRTYKEPQKSKKKRLKQQKITAYRPQEK